MLNFNQLEQEIQRRIAGALDTAALTCMATVPTSTAEPLTVAKLQALIESLPPLDDPLADWMGEQGFDPEYGGVLFLPAAQRAEWGFLPPPYIRFSPYAKGPTLANIPLLATPREAPFRVIFPSLGGA